MSKESVVKPSCFASGVSIDSLYRDYLIDGYNDLAKQGSVNKDQAMVFAGVLSSMVIAFKVARQKETADFILSRAQSLLNDWKLCQVVLLEIINHLDD